MIATLCIYVGRVKSRQGCEAYVVRRGNHVVARFRDPKTGLNSDWFPFRLTDFRPLTT